MTQESHNSTNSKQPTIPEERATSSSPPAPSRELLENINTIHPVLATVYFVIMLIYMMVLICKYSFSWRCRLIMASFVIVNAFKLIPCIIVYETIEEEVVSQS